MSATVRAIAWGISGLMALIIARSLASVHNQLALSATVIVGLIAVWVFGRGLIARQFFRAAREFRRYSLHVLALDLDPAAGRRPARAFGIGAWC